MTATDTYTLLRALADELARCGMTQACTSPGSRSTPLVMSLVRESRIQCFSHIDERCAGFFAVGAAKASGRPVALSCTSGTAAANLAPAVIEAHHARVPLVVLTADRPPELRDVGAGQTIDQVKLYGGAVKWFFEVGVHDATPERLRWIRTLACRAYWTALTGRAGPVHLNFPLREPLVLDAELPEDPTGRAGDRPYVTFDAPAPGPPAGGEPPTGRVVLVAGGEPGAAHAGERLAAFATRAQIPLLADPLSAARRGPAAIAHYDMLLRDPGFADAHRPQFVIRVGDLPTSKPLRGWLASLDVAAQIAIDPDGGWQDPDSVVGMRIAAPFGALLRPDSTSADPPPPMTTPGWLDSWRSADATMAEAIRETLGDQLSEPLVAARLPEWLPPQATLFVASSMPIRDVELLAPASERAPRVISNRGANGIDGTVSSAFGVAAATEGPVVLLIGDVALAYDIGGLLAAGRLGLRLTIVLLNNDGGGIFHFLPVAREGDAFEEHVATPHGLDFAHAAALYGCGYEQPEDAASLNAAVAASIERAGTTIIEVKTDRQANLALHRRMAEAALAALRRSDLDL
ncbi:MAG TPA: 2-succinyl-5-enolpyruvyl-6-hydroxy-3-cyclohexene-1-carboxylic-acid synthase [Solirubrobacteraceae bacterium]